MEAKVYQHYINGKLVDGKGELMEVIISTMNKVVRAFRAVAIKWTEEAQVYFLGHAESQPKW